jgi:CheY-like chemotaxis protein
VQEVKQQRHVLLVEDNEVNQKLAQAILSRRGWLVSVAGDGAQALDMLAAQAFDLVLMDMQMPVMDGLEASRRIRQHEGDAHLPRLPIVAMTANAMKGDRERCLAAGMDGYVSKPVEARRLFDEIERVFAGQHRIKTLGKKPASPTSRWPTASCTTSRRWPIAMATPTSC